MKCLIVEDESVSRRLLCALLSKLGTCHEAESGQLALDMFTETLDTGEHFDLVCLDIMMPEMDGHQVLEKIRSLEEEHGISESQQVKVLMTTSRDNPKDKFKAFRQQCEAYLVKPISRDKLLETLKALNLT